MVRITTLSIVAEQVMSSMDTFGSDEDDDDRAKMLNIHKHFLLSFRSSI